MKLQPIVSQPIYPQQNSFKMKYERNIHKITELSNKTRDTIKLDNGKELYVETLSIEDKMFSKLQYLKNKYGEWMKSKLTFYNGRGKRSIVKTSQNIELINEDKK